MSAETLPTVRTVLTFDKELIFSKYGEVIPARPRIAFIESRKRHGKEQYQKALQHFLKMTAKNERFGYVKEMS
jgi:hypothetical protein